LEINHKTNKKKLGPKHSIQFMLLLAIFEKVKRNGGLKVWIEYEETKLNSS